MTFHLRLALHTLLTDAAMQRSMKRRGTSRLITLVPFPDLKGTMAETLQIDFRLVLRVPGREASITTFAME